MLLSWVRRRIMMLRLRPGCLMQDSLVGTKLPTWGKMAAWGGYGKDWTSILQGGGSRDGLKEAHGSAAAEEVLAGDKLIPDAVVSNDLSSFVPLSMEPAVIPLGEAAVPTESSSFPGRPQGPHPLWMIHQVLWKIHRKLHPILSAAHQHPLPVPHQTQGQAFITLKYSGRNYPKPELKFASCILQ